MKKDETFHEHLSLAIASWSMGLSISVTHAERQQLHKDIVRALDYINAPDNEATAPIEIDKDAVYARLSALVHEVRTALLDQATDKNLTELAHCRRCMKLRKKIAAHFGQQ